MASSDVIASLNTRIAELERTLASLKQLRDSQLSLLRSPPDDATSEDVEREFNLFRLDDYFGIDAAINLRDDRTIPLDNFLRIVYNTVVSTGPTSQFLSTLKEKLEQIKETARGGDFVRVSGHPSQDTEILHISQHAEYASLVVHRATSDADYLKYH